MSIRVIPKSVKEETGHHALERLHHTPYRDEVRLFSCLQRGDLKKLIYELGQIGIQNITVGQMSENDLQQQKYMAVSFITLATRYAIQGGLGESNAYAYSDDFIRRIDAASAKRAVHAAIVDGAIELTNMVSRAQKDLTYSPHVRRCIAYINKNPDRKLCGCRGRPLRPVAGLSLPSVQMRIGRKPEHLYDRPKAGAGQNSAVGRLHRRAGVLQPGLLLPIPFYRPV